MESDRASLRNERSLDVLALVLSDVRYGLGAYLGVYLLAHEGWDAGSIGLTLTLAGLAGLLGQTPLCLLVDHVRAKRSLLAISVVVVTVACLAIPLAPQFGTVTILGVAGSIAGVTMAPTLASISLGVVGPARFAARACRNEGVFHLGNAVVNLCILLTAPFAGTQVIFWSMAVTGIASVAAVFALPARSIDYGVARGLLPGEVSAPPTLKALRLLAGSRPLLMFALCGALFHLANGSMLGLLAQELAIARPGQGVALTAASAIAAQCVMVPTAILAGWRADRWGRKPLLVVGFLALVVRALLYSWLQDPVSLIAAQLLDGLAAGLIGALFPVVIADVTRGAGYFAAAQGAVGAIHGFGIVLSAALSGWIAVRAGYPAAFLTLAAIAFFAAVLLILAMPETKPTEVSDRVLHPAAPLPLEKA